jgi:hypothetical protein
VVTGLSGNGRAITLALTAEGASVVCSDIHRETREGSYEGDILTPPTTSSGPTEMVRRGADVCRRSLRTAHMGPATPAA